MSGTAGAPIPAFVNPLSGSAAGARTAIEADARFELREVHPSRLAAAVRAEAERGTPRILVSGGDGSIAQAASAAAGTTLQVAIFPGGTLNHFARDFGVPLDDPAAALEAAATGTPRGVDLGYVNDHAILNTSSVGAYVNFVRTRERLERWLGYRLASLVAALGVWIRVRGFAVTLRLDDGTERHYRSPLVFVGIGERALDRAELGARAEGGASKLHVIVVREHTPGRLAALAFGAVTRGLDAFVHTSSVDSYLVDACTVTLRRRWGRVSIDGELVPIPSPLAFRIQCDAVTIVGP